MTRVVHRPEQHHHCDPGWTWEPSKGDDPVIAAAFPKGAVFGTPPSSFTYPAGTVWECNCGRTWVSRGTPESARDQGEVSICYWRREHWWERWFRRRGVPR